MKENFGTPDLIRGGDKIKRPYSWNRNGYSPYVNNIFERYTEGDPNVELIGMNNGKSIEVSLDDKEKIIFTHGLTGCYATVVFTEGKDGKRNCVLTHYASDSVLRNMDKVKELINQNIAMKEADKKQEVIIIGVGEWIKDLGTEKWKFEPNQKAKEAAGYINKTIRATLGRDVEMKLDCYSDSYKSGAKNQDILIVRIPSKNKGVATYENSCNIKKLGE
jgi:hypothetical protein